MLGRWTHRCSSMPPRIVQTVGYQLLGLFQALGRTNNDRLQTWTIINHAIPKCAKVGSRFSEDCFRVRKDQRRRLQRKFQPENHPPRGKVDSRAERRSRGQNAESPGSKRLFDRRTLGVGKAGVMESHPVRYRFLPRWEVFTRRITRLHFSFLSKTNFRFS